MSAFDAGKAAQEILRDLHCGDAFLNWRATAVKELQDKIAAALDAARDAALEEAAIVADKDALRGAEMLRSARSRYKKRELLAAIGYQGDPDAECIHLEACMNTSIDIAAAIRALKRPAGEEK